MKKTLIINSNMPDGIVDTLKLHYDLFLLDVHYSLPIPTAAHPDMQLLRLGDVLIAANGVKIPEEASKKYDVIYAQRELSNIYPSDVILNACLVGDVLLANTKSLEPVVSACCETYGIKICHVSQGYAKCSTLVIGERAIITADRSIASTACANGIDALLISPGHIELEGYDYGFIGGASHYDKDLNTVFFYGDIKMHPDCDKIIGFLKAHGCEYVYFNDMKLSDLGGAILL